VQEQAPAGIAVVVLADAADTLVHIADTAVAPALGW
jgi:hypothetical protein